VRGRLGYAADRFMPFVTGGGAFGDIRASSPGLPDTSSDKGGFKPVRYRAATGWSYPKTLENQSI
jgi:hypothetical protein